MEIESGLDSLGGRLKAVRIAKGWKLGYAAQALGLSRTSYGMWEADGVKRPDVKRLMAFTKLTKISFEWLLERRGDDPDLTPPAKIKASKEKRSTLAAPALVSVDSEVPEITGALVPHAKAINPAARATWHIPPEVVELSFHATPGKVVIQRIHTRYAADFGLVRGAYALLDTSRNRIDEAGVYLLGDPARWALVTLKDGNPLRIAVTADDMNRSTDEVSDANCLVLGRIMGIFEPT